MNNSNSNFGSQNSIPCANGTWGSFSSRYDRQPNYKKPGNSTANPPNLNEQNNTASDSTPQYQSNIEDSVAEDFKNTIGAGGCELIDTDQSNFNNYGNSSRSYGSQESNDNNGYQRNSHTFGSNQNQFKSNFFGSQHNRMNSNNFRSQSNQANSNDFGSQNNRWNSSNFGTRNFQFSSNNMSNSRFRSSSWFPGTASRPGSFGDNSNKFTNSNQQNQFSNQFNGSGGNSTSSNYVPFRKFRQHFSKRAKDASKTNDNTPPPSLFMGRDQSYPEELNNLMNPFNCGVCNSRLNSIKSANIHYESKGHDKQISNWMKKTYAEKGLAVPEVQRFVTEEANGPYRCELCKLDLTSAQHALQHYNGKRHRQVASKITPPTGIGYFNVDGNWVETGKVMDKVTGKETSYILVNTPSGFEPVVLHVASNTVAGVKRPAGLEAIKSEEQPVIKKPNLDQPLDGEKEKNKNVKEEQYRTMITEYAKNKQHQNTTNPTANVQFKTVSLDSQGSSQTGQTPQEALSSQQCKICGIGTTSYDQMLLHLKGIRHTKKLRALGEPPISNLFEKSSTTILESLNNSHTESDVSMYRTPTGSYYCKTCDVGLEDIARIKKHISSKAHSAAVRKHLEDPIKS